MGMHAVYHSCKGRGGKLSSIGMIRDDVCGTINNTGNFSQGTEFNTVLDPWLRKAVVRYITLFFPPFAWGME